MGRTTFEDGPSADSCGKSQIQSFAFPFPASSTCARSLLIPGTCDLTHERSDAPKSKPVPVWIETFDPDLTHLASDASDASDAAVPGIWKGRIDHAP
jgi:hypothetical protein